MNGIRLQVFPDRTDFNTAFNAFRCNPFEIQFHCVDPTKQSHSFRWTEVPMIVRDNEVRLCYKDLALTQKPLDI